MASLALVCPALGHGAADAIETGGLGKLTKPATDEDLGEVVVALFVLAILAGGENLAECAVIELVDHDTVAGDDGVHGVGLELRVLGELLHAQLGAPFSDDAHVA